MNNRLLLYIDERWPVHPSTPWVVLDGAGRLVAEGESGPAHWPAAETCELILGGPQTLWLQVSLPKAARREHARVLAYALEEHLLSDPDTQHLSLTGRQAPVQEGLERVGVLAIAKDRLRIVLAQLAAIGRRPIHAWSELQTAPYQRSGWSISIGSLGAVLRIGEQEGLWSDISLLKPMLDRKLATGQAPEKIVLHPAPGHPKVDLANLFPSAGPAWTEGDSYHWWAGAARPGGLTELLQGEFAPRHRNSGWRAKLKPAAWLAAGACGIWLLAGLGEVAWLRHQMAEVDGRMVRIHQTSFPNTPAVAPAAQMRRALDEARARAGKLRSDDMLALLAQVAESGGADLRDGVRSLRYEGGRLELLLDGAGARRTKAIVSLLAARGLQADVREEGGSARLVVRNEVMQ